MQNTSPPPQLNPGSRPPLQKPKGSRWLLYVCGAFAALFLFIVASVAITVWWIQRPIKPVVLSAAEKAVVDQKIQRLTGKPAAEAPATDQTLEAPRKASATAPALDAPKTPTPVPDTAGKPARPSEIQAVANAANPDEDRPYVPGSKVLKLTEREINGLLNANTEFGKSLRLEFGRNAINAYLAVPIPKDFPVGGGKMFRARGRFLLSLGQDGAPYAILEDFTVFGLSLPKAWLGDLKGKNLISQAMGADSQESVLRGIKSLRIEPGTLVMEVED